MLESHSQQTNENFLFFQRFLLFVEFFSPQIYHFTILNCEATYMYLFHA